MKRAFFYVLGLLIFSETVCESNGFDLTQSIGMAKNNNDDIVWQVEKKWESAQPAIRSFDKNIEYSIQKYVYKNNQLEKNTRYLIPYSMHADLGQKAACAVDEQGTFFAAFSAAQSADYAVLLHIDQHGTVQKEYLEVTGLQISKIFAQQSEIFVIGQTGQSVHVITRSKDDRFDFYSHQLTSESFILTDAVLDSTKNIHMSCVVDAGHKFTHMAHFDYKTKKWTSNQLVHSDLQEIVSIGILPTRRGGQDQLVFIAKNEDGKSYIAWTDTQAKKAQIIDEIPFDAQALVVDSSNKFVVAGYDKTDFVCARYTKSGRYTKAEQSPLVVSAKKNQNQRSALFTGICELSDGSINADVTYHSKDFYGITRDVHAPLVTAHVHVTVTDTQTPGTQINDLYAYWNGYASVVSIRQLTLSTDPIHNADDEIDSFTMEGFALVNELTADDTSDIQSLSPDPSIIFVTPAPGAAASATVTVTMVIEGQTYVVPLTGTMNIPVDFHGNPHVSGGIFSGTIPGTGGESLVLIVDPTDSVTAGDYSSNISAQLDVAFDTDYVGVTVAATVDDVTINQSSVSPSWYVTGLHSVTFYTDEALENPVSTLTITVPEESETEIPNTAQRTFYLQGFVNIEPAGVPLFAQTNVPVTGTIIVQTDDDGNVSVLSTEVSIAQDGQDVDWEGDGGLVSTQEGGYDMPNDDLGGLHTIQLTLGYNHSFASTFNASNLSVLVDTVSDNHTDTQAIIFNSIRYNGISSYVQITHVVLDPETIIDENTNIDEDNDAGLHRWVLVNEDGYEAYQYDDSIDFFHADNTAYWQLPLTGDGYVLLGDAQYIHVQGTAYLLPPDSDTFISVQLQGDIVVSCDTHGNVTIPTISMFIDDQPTAVYQALYTSGLGVAQDMSVTIYVHPVDEESFNAVAGLVDPDLDGSDIVPVDALVTIFGRSRFDGIATRIDVDNVAINSITQPYWILQDIVLGTDVAGVITPVDTESVAVEVFGTATLHRTGELTTVYSDEESPSDSAQYHDDADNGGSYDVLLRGTVYVNVDEDGNVSLADGVHTISAYHLDDVDGIDEQENRSAYTGRNHDIDIVFTVTDNHIATIDQSVQNARIFLTGTEKYNGDGSYISITQITLNPLHTGLDDSPTNALFNDSDWSYVYDEPVLSGDFVIGGTVSGDVQVDINQANPTGTVQYNAGQITITSAAGTEFIRSLDEGPELQIGSDGVLTLVNQSVNTLTNLTTDDAGARFRLSTGIAATYDGKLYITNGAGGEDNSGFITIVDTLHSYNTSILDDGFNQPNAAAYSLANNYVYVTNPGGGGNSGAGFISIIDVETQTVVGSIGANDDGINFNNPIALAIAPESRLLYVANYLANTISVIDVDPAHTVEQGYDSDAYNTQIATISVGGGPRALALSLNGTRLYVANYGSNTVSVINIAPLSDGFLDVIATVSVGSGPLALAISNSSFELYVANYHANTISVVDIYENSPSVYTVKNTFTTGIDTPQSLAVWGQNLYVTSNENESVSQITLDDDPSVALFTEVLADEYNPFLNPQNLLVYGNNVFVVDAGDNGLNSYGQLFTFQTSDSLVLTDLNTDMILNLVPVDITQISVSDYSTVSVDSEVTIVALYDGVTATIKELGITVDTDTISPSGWYATGISELEFNDGNDVIVLLSADGNVVTEPVSVTGVVSLWPNEDETVIGGDGGTNQFLEVPVSGSVQFTVDRYGNIVDIDGSIGFTNQGPNSDVTFTINVGTIINPGTTLDYSVLRSGVNILNLRAGYNGWATEINKNNIQLEAIATAGIQNIPDDIENPIFDDYTRWRIEDIDNIVVNNGDLIVLASPNELDNPHENIYAQYTRPITFTATLINDHAANAINGYGESVSMENVALEGHLLFYIDENGNAFVRGIGVSGVYGNYPGINADINVEIQGIYNLANFANPQAIAAAFDNKLYVANYDGGTNNQGSFAIFNLHDNTTAVVLDNSPDESYDLAGTQFMHPHNIIIDTTNNIAYVANNGNGDDNNGFITRVDLLDYATSVVPMTDGIISIDLDRPQGLALSPDKNTLYVTSFAGGIGDDDNGFIAEVNLLTNSAGIIIPDIEESVFSGPVACVISADGNTLYVANSGVDGNNGFVTIINLTNNSAVTLDQDNEDGSFSSPSKLVLDQPHNKLYVANFTGGNTGQGFISVINLTDNSVTKIGANDDSFELYGLKDIALSHDGRLLAAVMQNGGSNDEIDDENGYGEVLILDTTNGDWLLLDNASGWESGINLHSPSCCVFLNDSLYVANSQGGQTYLDRGFITQIDILEFPGMIVNSSRTYSDLLDIPTTDTTTHISVSATMYLNAQSDLPDSFTYNGVQVLFNGNAKIMIDEESIPDGWDIQGVYQGEDEYGDLAYENIIFSTAHDAPITHYAPMRLTVLKNGVTSGIIKPLGSIKLIPLAPVYYPDFDSDYLNFPDVDIDLPDPVEVSVFLPEITVHADTTDQYHVKVSIDTATLCDVDSDAFGQYGLFGSEDISFTCTLNDEMYIQGDETSYEELIVDPFVVTAGAYIDVESIPTVFDGTQISIDVSEISIDIDQDSVLQDWKILGLHDIQILSVSENPYVSYHAQDQKIYILAPFGGVQDRFQVEISAMIDISYEQNAEDLWTDSTTQDTISLNEYNVITTNVQGSLQCWFNFNGEIQFTMNQDAPFLSSAGTLIRNHVYETHDVGIDITVESTDLLQPTLDTSDIFVDLELDGDVVNNGRAVFVRIHDAYHTQEPFNKDQSGYDDTEYADFIIKMVDLSGDILVSLQNVPVANFPLQVDIPVQGHIILHHINQDYTESDGPDGIVLEGVVHVLVDADGVVYLDEYNPSYIIANGVGRTLNLHISCTVSRLGDKFQDPDNNFCIESIFYGLENTVATFITKNEIGNNFTTLLNRIDSASKLKNYIGLDQLINTILLHTENGLVKTDEYGQYVLHQEILHDGNDPDTWIDFINEHIADYELHVQENGLSFIKNIKTLADQIHYDLENSDALNHAHSDAQKIIIQFFRTVLYKLYIIMNHKN